ncbi:hypothetical protein JCM10207_008788 [Rhodosporidiobolus poonsookiae]
MLLRNRIDGAVLDYETTDDCRGDMLFDDGKRCRTRIRTDTLKQPVCGGNTAVHFYQTYRPDRSSFQAFTHWLAAVLRDNKLHSPIYVTGLGIHEDFVPLPASYLDSIFSTLSSRFPTPLNLFAGPHAPPHNQKTAYRERQGPARVKAFYERLTADAKQRSVEGEFFRGGARVVDYYAATDGAVSYDGGHFSYQVNMEKAQILLNLLDIAWGEIVAAGGMAVTEA